MNSIDIKNINHENNGSIFHDIKEFFSFKPLEEHTNIKLHVDVSNDSLDFKLPFDKLSQLDQKTINHICEDLTKNNIPFLIDSNSLNFNIKSTVNDLSIVKDIVQENLISVESKHNQVQKYFTSKTSNLKLEEPAYKNNFLYQKVSEIFNKIRTLNQQDRHVGYDITKFGLGLSLIVLPTGLDYETKGLLKEGVMNTFKLYNDPKTRPLFYAHINKIENNLKDFFSNNHKVDLTQNLNTNTKVTFDFDTDKNLTFLEFKNIKLPESQFEKQTHLIQRQIQRQILDAKIVNNKIFFEVSKQNMRIINDILNKKNLNINHVPNENVKKALSEIFITNEKIDKNKQTKMSV